MTTRITWKHHSLIQNLRADEMIARQSETDQRLSAMRVERETMLDEIAAFIRKVLGVA